MRKELSSEAEYHLSWFYWYTEMVEFLSNRLSGTDYQTILNKRFKDQHLDLEYDFQIVFDEHPLVSDFNSEVSKVITDQEFIEVVTKHRGRLLKEKNRLIQEIRTAKPTELEKFMQWHLLHQTTKPSRFQKEPRIYRCTTCFYISEKDYQIVAKTGKGIEMIVVPDQGEHPEGTYDIPNDVMMRFFELKRQDNNWIRDNYFKQDGIPSLLKQYFDPTTE